MPEPKENKPKWEEEFDERFVNSNFLEIKGYGKDTYVSFMGHKIKAFIQEKIDEAYTEGYDQGHNDGEKQGLKELQAITNNNE